MHISKFFHLIITILVAVVVASDIVIISMISCDMNFLLSPIPIKDVFNNWITKFLHKYKSTHK